DNWVIIAAGNNKLFERLCLALGFSNDIIKDSRFMSNTERVKNRDELHELLESRTKMFRSNELVSLLRTKKIPCSIINTIDKVYNDEQVKSLNMIKEINNFRI